MLIGTLPSSSSRAASQSGGSPLTLASIVATVGPASADASTIRKLILAGVSVFRLNFSHGAFEGHEATLRLIRAAADEMAVPIGVLGDLPGPKIRLGEVAIPRSVAAAASNTAASASDPGTLELLPGDEMILAPGARTTSRRPDGVWTLPCGYARIADDVLPGHRVLINDGAVRSLALEVVQTADGPGLLCRVTGGGPISTRKGINLPDSALRVESMQERDWQAVEFAVKHGLDYLALSFVRTASEVTALKNALRQRGAPSIVVVAKIEKPQAVQNIDEIAQAADAIMVARGDLGVEIDIADVPIVQRHIIATADNWGKPCIVATQMLESMITGTVPTRAEATDVSNAVLAGADAVMLSGETAVGRHPALVVETMRRIVSKAEVYLAEHRTSPSPPRGVIETGYPTAALAHGAWWTARDVRAKMVVCWSQSGGAARYLSQTGFAIPIVAYSSSQAELRRMALLRGVQPLYCPLPDDGSELSLAEWNRRVDAELLRRGWCAPGDTVLLLAGRPLGVPKTATMLAVHRVGETTTGFGSLR